MKLITIQQRGGGGLPNLLQYYNRGGGVHWDPKFVLRNKWTAPNLDLLDIEDGGDLILMMVVIALVLVMSMTTSNIDKELQNSLNISSFC